MNALVFAPQFNVPGKRDADEFRREAHAFCQALGLKREVILFDNQEPPYERRERVYVSLDMRAPKSLDVVAFFCHGWPTGIQAGFDLSYTRKLALCLKARCKPDLKVLLYCCSAGADNDGSSADEKEPGPGGDGGFADKLRDALGDVGVRGTVYAHSTRGHTTVNPFVRVFEAGSTLGGEWTVDPGSKLFGPWRRALRESDDFRFRFPFMTRDEIDAELTA